MGSNLSCTQDDEMHSIHAANSFYPQSTMRLVSAETLRESVYIPLQYTPSPSPNLFTKKRVLSRLPKKEFRTLEPVISGESWDSFSESYSKRTLIGTNTEERQEALRRCVSDRQRYLKVKAAGKRSSVPIEILRKQLRKVHFAEPQSLPCFLTDESAECLGGNLMRDSTDRSGLETPISDIFIDMDTTRSRPGWNSALACATDRSLRSFVSSGTWHEDNLTVRRRIGEILSVEGSDSQFAIPSPIKSPIFSSKVRRFAMEDEERCSMVVEKLQQTFISLPHRGSNSTSSDSVPPPSISSQGSPPSHIVGGGVLSTPTPRAHSNSIGGALFPLSPPSSQVSTASWRMISSLEKTRVLANKIQNSPELMEKMAKELEELSSKYAKMVHHSSSQRVAASH